MAEAHAPRDEETRAGASGRLAEKMLTVQATMLRLLDRARQPDFRLAEWDELRRAYAPGYRRIAANRDARDWDEDLRLRHAFAQTYELDIAVRRIAQSGSTVFMDLVEAIRGPGGFTVHTLSVIEFDADERIVSTTTYQQWPPGQAPRHLMQHD